MQRSRVLVLFVFIIFAYTPSGNELVTMINLF